MWDLPGPGIKPLSPALAGGFLTTEPPGKSQHLVFLSGKSQQVGQGMVCIPESKLGVSFTCLMISFLLLDYFKITGEQKWANRKEAKELLSQLTDVLNVIYSNLSNFVNNKCNIRRLNKPIKYNALVLSFFNNFLDSTKAY